MPIRVRECELKGLLRPIIRIDLVNVDDELTAREKLLSGAKFERAKPEKPPIYPGTFERVISKKPGFPGLLPIVWNVPLPRNPNFTGRDPLLSDLQAALTSGKPVALQGLGGMGKTQLAVEYAYRYGSDYNAVWRVRSKESATAAGDYAELARELNLPHLDGSGEVIKAVRLWLRRNDDWLLIFDNAEGPSDLLEYLPQGGSGHVIITSRDSTDWGKIATPLPIREFDREESIEFLGARTKKEDETTADALAEALGDLPLALEQAGAYINWIDISLAEYLELFKNRRKELWNDERSPLDYHKDTVATTWTLAMDRIKEEAPEGSDLLNLCAFLAPDDIPRKLFSEWGDRLPESLADVLALNRAIVSLRRYSLLDADTESLFVHKLVQTVTRDRLTEDNSEKWAGAALILVNSAFPLMSDDVKIRERCSSLLPHAMAVTENSECIWTDLNIAARLLNESGRYLIECAEYSKAKSMLESALEIALDPVLLSAVTSNLGEALRNLGEFEDAKLYLLCSLEIHKGVYVSNNLDKAKIIGNIGLVLRDMEKPELGKEYFERALNILKNITRPYSKDILMAIATSFNNLGLTYLDLGDPDSLKCARKYLKKIS